MQNEAVNSLYLFNKRSWHLAFCIFLITRWRARGTGNLTRNLENKMYTSISLLNIHISLTNINAIKTWRIWHLQDSPDEASIRTAVHCIIKLLSCNPYLLCKLFIIKQLTIIEKHNEKLYFSNN